MNAKEPFTHLSTELCATVWALPDDAKGSRVTLQVSANLVLAALLGRHSVTFLSLSVGAVDKRWLIYIPRRVSLCTGLHSETSGATWLRKFRHLVITIECSRRGYIKCMYQEQLPLITSDIA